MSNFRIRNDVRSELTQAIDSTQTTMRVAKAISPFRNIPPLDGGTLHLTLVDNLADVSKIEVVNVTAISDETSYWQLTVERGAEETSSYAFDAGAPVFLAITQDAYNAKQDAADLNIGNWDTAFGWGDHAAAGYELAANLGSLAYAEPESAGVQVGTPAGNFPGAGKINAEGVQVDGVDVLKVGDFGLATAVAPFYPFNDLDDAHSNSDAASGIWGIDDTYLNTPNALSGIGLLVTDHWSGSFFRQQIIDRSNPGREWFRVGRRGRSFSAWVERWHSGNLEYDTDIVSLGGDFGTGAGSEVKCVRVGDQVTITGVGVLTHTAGGSPTSASGIIPTKYRPAATVQNVFGKETLTGTHYLRIMEVAATGTVRVVYTQTDGTGSASPGSTSTMPSITYNV